jgi:hypothetical protein
MKGLGLIPGKLKIWCYFLQNHCGSNLRLVLIWKRFNNIASENYFTNSTLLCNFVIKLDVRVLVTFLGL